MASTTTTSPSSSSSPAAAAAAQPLTGSCLCGNITYAIAGGVEPVANVICYCENCTKQTGTHMQNSSVFPADAFTITSVAAPHVYADTKVASGNVLSRHFCDRCGSPIYSVSSRPEGKEFVSVAVGTLDRDQAREWVWTPNMVFWEEARPAWLEKIQVVEKERPEGWMS